MLMFVMSIGVILILVIYSLIGILIVEKTGVIESKRYSDIQCTIATAAWPITLAVIIVSVIISSFVVCVSSTLDQMRTK